MKAKHTATPITSFEFLPVAGACFMEPEEGDLRLKRGTVEHFMPSDPRADEDGFVSTPGFLVQEYGPRYSKDGFELCGGGVWRTVGPLNDYPALLSDLPEDVRAAISKATGSQA